MYNTYNTYKTKKMPEHGSAACNLRYYDNSGVVVLKSYYTDVAAVDTESGWAICTGTYSRTTIKHIGWFTRLFKKPGGGYYDYLISYYDFKAAAGAYAFNIYTGEACPLDQFKGFKVYNNYYRGAEIIPDFSALAALAAEPTAAAV